jgi:ATP-binding cassette subfamily C protein
MILGYFVVGLFEMLGIMMIFPIVALIVDPLTIMEMDFLKNYFASVSPEDIKKFIPFLAIIMVVSLIAKNVFSILISRWQIFLVNGSAADLSKFLFRNYIRMPYLESLSRDSSFLNYTVNAASNIIYNSYLTPFLQIVSEIITIFVIVLFMLSVDIKVTLLMIFLNVFAGSILFFYTKNKLKDIGYKNRIFSEKLVRVLKETFSSFKEFKVLSKEDFFEKKFNSFRDQANQAQSRQMTFVMLNRNVIEVIFLLAVSLVVTLLFMEKSKAYALAQLTLYGMISIRFIPAISRIFSSLQTMKTAENTIDLLLSEKEFIENYTSLQNCEEGKRAIKKVNNLSKSHIIFKNVSFDYNSSKSYVLNELTFEIFPHTAVGIIGRTGAGKTTIADMILGLIVPSKGSITINGQNLSKILPKWKNYLGYVPQKIAFMEASIIENIAFGIEKDQINLKRIHEVINITQLTEDIQTFKDGLQTVIREDGSNLSGGQKQRIGLARALYHKPAFLVLDEATSALDVETEAKISETIKFIKQECSLLIIAHRLSTVKECDNLLYIDKGRLIAQGKFEELKSSNKRFIHLLKLSGISS